MATEFAIHTFESAETGTEAGRVTHMPPKVIATRGAEAEAAESQRNSQTAPFTWLRACINIESCAPVAINNFQSQCGTNAGSAAAAAATLALVFTTNAASAGTDETNQRATMSRNPTLYHASRPGQTVSRNVTITAVTVVDVSAKAMHTADGLNSVGGKDIANHNVATVNTVSNFAPAAIWRSIAMFTSPKDNNGGKIAKAAMMAHDEVG